MTFRDELKEWVDADIASYFVAVYLGLVPPVFQNLPFGNKKGLFWSNNKLGESLYSILQILVENGVLEEDKEEAKFRWNVDFDWSQL